MRHRSGPLLRGMAMAFALLCTPSNGAPALWAFQEEAEEYAVKAQFLVNLIPYVQWPDGGSNTGKPLVLVVLGFSPFGSDLDQAVRRSPRPQGRPLQVVYLERVPEELSCDLLFIAPSMYQESKTILRKTRNRPILTLADDARLAGAGVMMNLLLQGDGRVHLVVNRDVAVQEGFAISSQLLRLARLVHARRPDD